jgi:hypothetical protein
VVNLTPPVGVDDCQPTFQEYSTSIVFGTKNVCDDIVGQYFNLRESFMTLFLQHSLASLFLKYSQQVKIYSFLDFKNPRIFYFLAENQKPLFPEPNAKVGTDPSFLSNLLLTRTSSLCRALHPASQLLFHRLPRIPALMLVSLTGLGVA